VNLIFNLLPLFVFTHGKADMEQTNKPEMWNEKAYRAKEKFISSYQPL